MNNNTNHIREVQLVISFALLCLTGIAGVSAWPKKETALGYFKISENAYGIGIYQDKAHATVEFANATSFETNGTTATISTLSDNPTILYGRDDIIFDATGVIYTEPTEGEIHFLSQKLGISMRKPPTSDRTINLATNVFYLVNPHIPGVLNIRISGNAPLWINRDEKSITSEQRTGISYEIRSYDVLSAVALASK